MVSASDFAYIPTVIIVSYFGSKGNRAKWIGAGAFITSASHLFISSSNFVFPIQQSFLNITTLKARLLPSREILAPNATFAQLFDYEPIKDRINEKMREKFLKKIASINLKSAGKLFRFNKTQMNGMANYNDSYTLDENQLSKIYHEVCDVIEGDKHSSVMEVKYSIQQYIRERAEKITYDLFNIQNSARAPFAFCSNLINDLRKIIRESKCNKDQSFHEIPFMMLFVGLIGLGIGRTMPWSLGVPMIDDNVSNKNLPAFFAGISFVRILGPVCGFLIGSLCSSFYYTLRPPPGLTAKDPTWIGAWWVGYMFIGLLLIIPSIALYFFPVRSKPIKITQSLSSDKCNNEFVQQNEEKILSIFDKYQKNDDHLSTYEKFKEFRKAYALILHSKVFIGILIARVIDLLAFRGYMVFLPKYLENQFGIPQYNVHILMASFGVFGFALGTISGGVIVRRYKLNGRYAAIFVVILSAINTMVFFSKAFIGCYSIVNKVGANGFSTDYNYTRLCNINCGCQSAPLFPVCDKSGYVFFSPCHAGCRAVKVINVNKYELEFSSCECRPGEILTKNNCQDDCKLKALLFFCLVMLGSFAAGNCLVPGMLLLLRSVPPEHRSIALGLQGFLVSLFASLPSPLIWGAIVDTACLVWSHACPGTEGACAIYEPVQLRQRLHFTYFALRVTSVMGDLYVVKHAQNLKIMDDRKNDNIKMQQSHRNETCNSRKCQR